MTVQPLAPIAIDQLVAALPKADLHLHQEAKARLDKIAARRQGRPPFDRRNWAQRVVENTPPGMARLDGVYEPEDSLNLLNLEGTPDDDENFIARVTDVLEEGAGDGAILIEVRFGADELLARPNFMALFREAARRARERHLRLCTEAIGYLGLVNEPERLAQEELRLDACLHAAREGLAGVDFRIDPYETEADPELWAIAYQFAERAACAGLGVTVHAGEFSTANLAEALRVPGLRRLGHAVYAASDPRLMEELARSGATVEFSLTCNVILGAVPSYEAHPIRQFVEAGIPVTLNTDLPVHVCTTIGREYAVAASLGFSTAELLAFTRNAIKASFAPAERRATLVNEVDQWEAGLSAGLASK